MIRWLAEQLLSKHVMNLDYPIAVEQASRSSSRNQERADQGRGGRNFPPIADRRRCSRPTSWNCCCYCWSFRRRPLRGQVGREVEPCDRKWRGWARCFRFHRKSLKFRGRRTRRRSDRSCCHSGTSVGEVFLKIDPSIKIVPTKFFHFYCNHFILFLLQLCK